MVTARARNGRVRADYHVAELSGRTMFSAVDLAIKNDPGADAFGNQHKNKVARVTYLWSTEPKFSQSNRIRVVIDHYRQTGPRGNHFSHGKITPLKIRNVDRRASRRINKAGETHSNRLDGSVLLVQKIINAIYYRTKSLFGIGISREVELAENATGEIASRNSGATGSHRQADGDCPNCAQPQQGGRSASGRFAFTNLFNQAFRLQRVDNCRYG